MSRYSNQGSFCLSARRLNRLGSLLDDPHTIQSITGQKGTPPTTWENGPCISAAISSPNLAAAVASALAPSGHMDDKDLVIGQYIDLDRDVHKVLNKALGRKFSDASAVDANATATATAAVASAANGNVDVMKATMMMSPFDECGAGRGQEPSVDEGNGQDEAGSEGGTSTLSPLRTTAGSPLYLTLPRSVEKGAQLHGKDSPQPHQSHPQVHRDDHNGARRNESSTAGAALAVATAGGGAGGAITGGGAGGGGVSTHPLYTSEELRLAAATTIAIATTTSAQQSSDSGGGSGGDSGSGGGGGDSDTNPTVSSLLSSSPPLTARGKGGTGTSNPGSNNNTARLLKPKARVPSVPGDLDKVNPLMPTHIY